MASQWLPSYMIPFFSLSYPTDTPSDPDSFPNAVYYNTGAQDLCLIITCIAVMAALRDALRLGVMEPFARWKLYRDLQSTRLKQAECKTANGNGNSLTHGHAAHANGNAMKIRRKEDRQMHRSVLRFAEQGWSVVYYTLQWSFGLVRLSILLAPFGRVLNLST